MAQSAIKELILSFYDKNGSTDPPKKASRYVVAINFSWFSLTSFAQCWYLKYVGKWLGYCSSPKQLFEWLQSCSRWLGKGPASWTSPTTRWVNIDSFRHPTCVLTYITAFTIKSRPFQPSGISANPHVSSKVTHTILDYLDESSQVSNSQNSRSLATLLRTLRTSRYSIRRISLQLQWHKTNFQKIRSKHLGELLAEKCCTYIKND